MKLEAKRFHLKKENKKVQKSFRFERNRQCNRKQKMNLYFFLDHTKNIPFTEHIQMNPEHPTPFFIFLYSLFD